MTDEFAAKLFFSHVLVVLSAACTHAGRFYPWKKHLELCHSHHMFTDDLLIFSSAGSWSGSVFRRESSHRQQTVPNLQSFKTAFLLQQVTLENLFQPFTELRTCISQNVLETFYIEPDYLTVCVLVFQAECAPHIIQWNTIWEKKKIKNLYTHILFQEVC